MQFIYAFLFLIYLTFLPSNPGWAINLLWAMMILPLADVLQNTLQNLVSRIAGIQNDELANRGIGMAHEMGHTIRAFAYQFGDGKNSNTLNRFMEKTTVKQENRDIVQTSPVQTKPVQTNPVETKPIESKIDKNTNSNNIEKKETNNIFQKTNFEKATKFGSAFLNTGMFMAEGRNFKNDKFNKNNINDNIKRNRQDINTTTKMEMDKYDK